MKKRLFAITLAEIVSLVLPGCGKSDKTNSETENMRM